LIFNNFLTVGIIDQTFPPQSPSKTPKEKMDVFHFEMDGISSRDAAGSSYEAEMDLDEEARHPPPHCSYGSKG